MDQLAILPASIASRTLDVHARIVNYTRIECFFSHPPFDILFTSGLAAPITGKVMSLTNGHFKLPLAVAIRNNARQSVSQFIHAYIHSYIHTYIHDLLLCRAIADNRFPIQASQDCSSTRLLHAG